MSKLRANKIESLNGKGEGLLSYSYEAGLVVKSYNTIIRDGDSMYRVSESESLPYTLTGAGAPEGGSLVAVGVELPTVTTLTGTQTLPDSLNRRGVHFAALRAPESGTFNPEDYLETSTKIQQGAFCYTLGYCEPGDGGGNDYQVVAAGTGADDGGSFIDLAGSGLQARGLFGDVVTLQQFGAINDGVTDTSHAIQASIAHASLSGIGKVKALPGRYYYTSKATQIIPNKAFERGFSFVGSGSSCTQFISSKGNSDGLISLIDSSNQTTFFVGGFSCLSTLHKTNDAGLHNGTPVEINSQVKASSPGFGDRAAFGAYIADLHIAGDGLNSGSTGVNGRWLNGVVVENIWYPIVNNCHIRSVADDVSKKGVKFLDCYDPRTKDTYVRGGWRHGIWHDTSRTSSLPSYEGGYVRDCTIVGAYTSVYINHDTEIPLYEPGFHVTGCHMNYKNYGVHVNYHRQIVIDSNYWYMARESQTEVALPASVYLERASDTTISACQFLEPGFYNSETSASVGVMLGADTTGTLIDGNIFNHGGIGIVNNATVGSNQNVVGSNLCAAGQRPGWAAFTYIVDNAGTLCSAGLSEARNAIEHVDKTNTAVIGGFVASRLRTDYATNSNAELSGFTVIGRNSAGSNSLAYQLRTDWADNTAGSETTVIRGYQRLNGSNQEVYRISTDGKLNAPKGFSRGANAGVSGTFTTNDGKTITISGGIVTGIV